MMLEAIYAWRRNGGMGSPRSERSDAIMDLRAASRNSNSSEPERSRWLGLGTTASHSLRGASPLSGFWISVETSNTTPPPWPGSRFFSHLVSAREIDHRFFAKEASGLHYLVRCTFATTFAISQLGGKIPLSMFPPGTNRYLSCQNPLRPEQAPNGILLTTGSVAQSPACHACRVFWSLDLKV